MIRNKASWTAEFIRLVLGPCLRGGSTASRPGVRASTRKELRGYERWILPPPRRMQSVDANFGGVPASVVWETGTTDERHILFLHGGGYAAGSPTLYRHITWRFADAAAARVIAPDYRLAPEHPYPAALDDALAAWRAMLASGVEARRCAFVGDSAGGGLALALALRLRDEGGSLPGAIVAISPWTDLAVTGESARPGASDPMLNAGDLAPIAALYLAGADPRAPYASPLYGNPEGLPPTLIQVGSDEILLDDSRRMAARMREAGCDVTLEAWPRMPHVWHAFAPILPEAGQAIARVGAFVREKTGVAARYIN
ncbi:MAG TPA: alpha/beta hydrolase [Rhizomicrobium sp.]|jgi:acetyl esterase/lipase|nr:alpha/beta hydrolase [Rhizomicrobium sp.]